MKLAPWLISIAVAAAAGAAVFFMEDRVATARLQALQRQLDETRVQLAKKNADDAYTLERARRADEERKAGDLAKQKELAIARQRAEAEATTRADLDRTIRGCARLLPKGKTYSVSLNATIDTSGPQPHLTGGLDVSDGTKKNRQGEGEAFAQCVGRLVR
jgi:hypothetical protein